MKFSCGSAPLSLFVVLITAPLAAQQPAPSSKPVTPAAAVAAASAPDYSHEDVIVDKFHQSLHLNDDGTAETETDLSERILTEAGLRAQGVLHRAYMSGSESIEFKVVRVTKADGTRIDTPGSDAQDVATEVTQQAPMYSDVRIKDLPIHGLAVGDRLDYTVVEHLEHPLAPGQYWQSLNLPHKDYVCLDYQLTFDLPAAKYVNVMSKDIQPTVRESAGRKIYTWHTANTEPTKKPDSDDDKDSKKKDKKKEKDKDKDKADIRITTFRNWAEVGRWYGGLQAPRLEVTPEIKAQADTLVKGASADEDRIRNLYSFVSEYRYVGVDLGLGRYQPHAASVVLDNRFGDCKDKHTLLAALMKAEGYTADAALIHADVTLDKDFPSPSQFNHVITSTLVGGKRIWMDATTETAPFRFLMAGLRDQDALLVPQSADPQIVKTPADAPYAMSGNWTSDGKFADDGSYKGSFHMVLHDDTEIAMRRVFRTVPQAKWDIVMQSILGYFQINGKVSDTTAGGSQDLSKPLDVGFSLKLETPEQWGSLQIRPVIPNLPMPLSADADAPTEPFAVGGQGVTTLTARMELPEGYSAQLPTATRFHASWVDYSTEYALDKNVLTVTRRISLAHDKAQPAEWDEYLRWLRLITDDEGRLIQVLRPGEKAGAVIDSDPEAARLVSEGWDSLRNGDLDRAERSFEEAKEINPKQEWLHADIAVLLERRGKYDEGIAEYRKELELYPQKSTSAGEFAASLVRLKQLDAATRAYSMALEFSPQNPALLGGFGALLMEEGKPSEAVTLVQPIGGKPDATSAMKQLLARALVEAHRAKEAEPLLSSIMDKSDDQYELNNAAYFASEGNVMLPQAQKAAAKSLNLLETGQADVKLSSLTQKDLANVTFTGDVWDTLGWIYFQQGNVAKARAYVEAAWLLRQAPTIGEHLGEILEKQGDRANALTQYRLAETAAHGELAEDSRKAADRAAALEKSGVSAHGQADAGTLSAEHALDIPNTATEGGSAEFFVMTTATGVEDTLFLSGAPALRDMVQQLKTAKFKTPFPPDSKSRLARRGVLSCKKDAKTCRAVLLLPQYTKPQN